LDDRNFLREQRRDERQCQQKHSAENFYSHKRLKLLCVVFRPDRIVSNHPQRQRKSISTVPDRGWWRRLTSSVRRGGRLAIKTAMGAAQSIAWLPRPDRWPGTRGTKGSIRNSSPAPASRAIF